MQERGFYKLQQALKAQNISLARLRLAMQSMEKSLENFNSFLSTNLCNK